MRTISENRYKAIRRNMMYFVCFRLRNRFGNKIVEREAIRVALEGMGISKVMFGDRDVSMYIPWDLDDTKVLHIKSAVVKASGIQSGLWYLGHYIQTVGVVDVEAYKSYIAGL